MALCFVDGIIQLIISINPHALKVNEKTMNKINREWARAEKNEFNGETDKAYYIFEHLTSTEFL